MRRKHDEWDLTGASMPRADGSASPALGTTFQRSSGPSRVARLVGQAVSRAVDALMVWQERGRARRQLASLNDQMLRDLGITRADVDQEYRKPFWRT